MSATEDQIIDALESADLASDASYNLRLDDGYFCAEMHTKIAGEDTIMEIEFKSKDVEDLLSRATYMADGFDVDDHVESLVFSRGKSGIPTSIRTLLDSADEQKAFMLAVTGIIKKVVEQNR